MKTKAKNKVDPKTGKITKPPVNTELISARNARIILFAIIIITGLIYLKTSSFSFVNWDDDENITGNTNLKLSADNIKYHFEYSRYKALAIWSFMADDYLFGDQAGKYHIHNVILHLINILLVFVLIRRIAKKEITALIVAGFFALHPVFVEAVAWASGRKDLLFLLFSLLSIFSYRHYLLKEKKIQWLLPVIFFVYIASLAKIQAFTLPLIFLCFDWYEKRSITLVMFVEKAMLIAFIADKWFVVLILSFLTLLLWYFNERIEKIDKGQVARLLFWYLLTFAAIITLTFILRATIKGKLTFIIFSLLSCVLIFIFFRKKDKIISRISSWNSSLLIISFLIPLGIIAIGLFRTKYLFSDSILFAYWNNQLSDYFSFSERFLLAAKSLSVYILNFILVRPQNPMIAYPRHTADGSLPAELYSILVVMLIVIAAAIFLLFRYGRKNRMILFGILWFIASISIVLHFIPIQGRVVAADRYAYPSYIGLFLIIATGINYLFDRYNKKIIWLMMLAVFILISIKTYSNISIWKNSKTLWQAAVKADPANHYALSALSMAYFKEDGDLKSALNYADQSIKIKSDHQYYNNRGKIKYYMYDFQGALEDFNEAIIIDSSSFAAYNNRGAVYQQLGEFVKAMKDYTKALSLKPDYPDALDNKKKVIRLIAIDSLVLNASSLSPSDTSEAILHIRVQSQNDIKDKNYEDAEKYLDRGIKLIPSYVNFYEQLSYIYQLKKDNVMALEIYQQGLAVLPGNTSLLLDRGIFYYNSGDTIKAFADWRNSAKLGNIQAQGMLRKYSKKN